MLDPLTAPSPLAEWQSIASARYETITQLRAEVSRLTTELAAAQERNPAAQAADHPAQTLDMVCERATMREAGAKE